MCPAICTTRLPLGPAPARASGSCCLPITKAVSVLYVEATKDGLPIVGKRCDAVGVSLAPCLELLDCLGGLHFFLRRLKIIACLCLRQLVNAWVAVRNVVNWLALFVIFNIGHNVGRLGNMRVCALEVVGFIL